MAKTLKLLVASVGGGMALGFGMKALSESAKKRSDTPEPGSKALQQRLSALEARLASLENSAPATGISEDVVARKFAQTEARIEEHVRQATGAATARLNERVTRMEETVQSQSNELRELREYSLNSERNIQRLLVGIERLVALQDSPAAPSSGATPTPEPRELVRS